MADEKVKLIIEGDSSGAEKALANIDKNLGASSKKIEKTSINFAGLSAAATGVAAAGASIIGVLGSAVSKVESMKAALTTAFAGDSSAAAEAFKTISDFAGKTPYQMEEVMKSFIKLKNMGLDPSIEALTSYGNTASSMGKGLNDMVEAVADAATGEFERLKEFGIRASQQGDKVAFTFRGVTTTVGKNSEEIQKYLLNIGNTNFAGGMDAQSKTLGGQISTLKDQFFLLADALGQPLLEPLKKLTAVFAGLAQSVIDLNKSSPELAKFAGYAVLLVTALSALAAPIFALAAAWPTISAGMATVASLVLAINAPMLLLAGGIVLFATAWSQNWGGIQEKTMAVVNAVTGFLNSLWLKLVDFWQDMKTIFANSSKETVEDTKTQFLDLGKFFDGALKGLMVAFSLAWDTIKIAVQLALDSILGIARIFFGIFSLDWGMAWSGVLQIFTGIASSIVSAFTAIFDAILIVLGLDRDKVVVGFSLMFDAVKAVVSASTDGIIATVKNMINYILKGVNTVIRGVNKVSAAAGKTGVTIPKINEIPMLAEGGIVTRPTMAVVGEAGAEAVIPLSKLKDFGGGGGNTFIFNGVVSSKEVAEEYADLMVRRLALSTKAN